jgi:hypothetical protein
MVHVTLMEGARNICVLNFGRDSSVGITTGRTIQGLIPGRGKKFSVLYSIHTGSGAHLAFYPMGTGTCIPGDKAAGA